LEVRYSAQALHDLHEIWRYIAHDRPTVADKVAERINTRCDSLAQFPGQGRLRPDISPGVRSVVVDRWPILYRVETDAIFIGRIIDGARHLGRIHVPRR
jgi:toxin ParE1/3/4